MKEKNIGCLENKTRVENSTVKFVCKLCAGVGMDQQMDRQTLQGKNTAMQTETKLSQTALNTAIANETRVSDLKALSDNARIANLAELAHQKNIINICK